MTQTVQERAQIIEPEIALTDTCDSCGPSTRALAIVETPSGNLYFCGHHLRKFLPKIISNQYNIVTEMDVVRDILFLKEDAK